MRRSQSSPLANARKTSTITVRVRVGLVHLRDPLGRRPRLRSTCPLSTLLHLGGPHRSAPSAPLAIRVHCSRFPGCRVSGSRTASRPDASFLASSSWDSSHLLQARTRADVECIDQGADFAEGHELDPETAALLPATAMDRTLGQEEAAKLIRRFERGIPKRAAAASVKRAVKRKLPDEAANTEAASG
jgi:hypothetical protein